MTRALLGAAVGLLAGIGLHLTWSELTPGLCVDEPRSRYCLAWIVLVLPSFAAAWAVVAGALLTGALKLLKQPRAWTASGLGCGFWLLLWIGAGSFGLLGRPADAIIVPFVAYALAGTCSGIRVRSSAHGEATGDWP